MLSSELFARSLGSLCTGTNRCHWCGAACDRELLHDDPRPLPFQKNTSYARVPDSPYCCQGCWLYRRKSVTVPFLGGGILDRQTASQHSWWVTEEQPWAIQPASYSLLRHLVLKPPRRFLLSLLLESGVPNLLHLAVCNDHMEIRADTELTFTVNNIPHQYTVYELREAMRDGPQGKGAGVRLLVELLGKGEVGEPVVFVKPPKLKEKLPRGRPVKVEDPLRAMVVQSGA